MAVAAALEDVDRLLGNIIKFPSWLSAKKALRLKNVEMRISSVHSQTNRKNEEVWKQTGFQKNSCSFFFSFLFFLHQWLGGTASVLTGKILLIFVELTQINRLSQSVVRVSCSTGVSQSCFFYAPRCRTSRC